MSTPDISGNGECPQLGRKEGSGKNYLMGDNFTVADAYLFAVTNWAKNFALDLSDLEAVQAFQKRVKSRPAVLESLKAEGLDS